MVVYGFYTLHILIKLLKSAESYIPCKILKTINKKENMMICKIVKESTKSQTSLILFRLLIKK